MTLSNDGTKKIKFWLSKELKKAKHDSKNRKEKRIEFFDHFDSVSIDTIKKHTDRITQQRSKAQTQRNLETK